MAEVIYQNVETLEDITKINEEIREQIKKAESRDKVTELKRRSRNEKKLESAQKRAWKEYEKTTKVANEHRHGGSEYSIGEKPDYV
jgi:vacuolar-type H+-ATPase subunit H